MSTLTAGKLNRADYDELYAAFAEPGDLHDAVSRMFAAVENIVSRHVEASA